LVDLTTAQINSALLYSSSYWGGSTITYSFPAAGASWSGYGADQEPSKAEYTVPNASQQAVMRTEIGVWDRLISPTIVETGDPGQIRIAFTNVDAITGDNAWGFAYPPPTNGGFGSSKSGDIWIDSTKAGSSFAVGSYDYTATLHELGHALGLKHTFEGGATLPAEYDNYRYSIMSYTPNADYFFTTITSNGSTIQGSRVGAYPTTPMLFDVAAIQARYGADPTTAAGDTVYTFDASKPIMQTLYDAGGNDTIDLSAHTRASIIDLTPGAFSSIAKWSASDQAAFYKAQVPGANAYIDGIFSDSRTYTWTDNLAIAFNTTIENVRGGSGNDRVLGNDAANNINGGGGGDTINGANGDDYIRGDAGNDSLVGGAGFDDINGNTGADTISGGDDNDWVVGGQDNDLIAGDNGNDIVYGNLGNDTLSGGNGDDWVRGGQGDDIVDGGAGNDLLWGDRGNDTVTGGAGADQFHIFVGAGVDRVTDFSSAEGDRVIIDGGSPYTLSFATGEAAVSLGNGDMLVLSGVTSAEALGNWLG
jgi:serralysin